MKNFPIAIKILLNLFFLILYLFIAIFSGNFIFGLVLSVFGKSVPGSQDPIHLKIAVIISFLVLVFTVLFRKQFYINIFGKEEENLEKIEKVFDNKNKKNTKKYVKKDFLEEEFDLEDDNLENNKMEIYIGKEIK